jgi:hypothetical protein
MRLTKKPLLSAASDGTGPDAALANGEHAVAIEHGALWRVDDATQTWVKVPSPGFACDCWMTADQPDTIWIADLGAARVLHVDLATGSVDRSVHVARPTGVAVGFGKVWIADQTTKSVLVLSD